jgi:hypothetical protein
VVSTRALLDALDSGEPRRVQRALACFVITNVARSPHHPLVEDAQRRCRALAIELGEDLVLAWSALAGGILSLIREEHVAALELLDEASRRFVALGTLHAREAAISRIAIAITCGNLGVDVPFARRAYAECIEDARARNDQFAGTWALLSRCWMQLSAGEPTEARHSLAEARGSWPRVADSLFAVTSLANEVALDLYESPATAWSTVERIEPEFRRLFSSLMPYPRTLFGRLASNCALAACYAGTASRGETIARIERYAEDTDGLVLGRASQAIIQSHLRTLAGDRRGALDLLVASAIHWARGRQRLQERATRLRIYQLCGDLDKLGTITQQLRALTVADPDRFALLCPGPPPP